MALMMRAMSTSSMTEKELRSQVGMATAPKSRRGRQEKRNLKDWRKSYESKSKATGEIVEVEDCGSVFRHGALFHGYKGANGIKYLPDEIELQMDFDYWEACHDEAPEHIPDYWTRLEHQAAIAAMGGMCGNTKYNDYAWVDMAKFAIKAAHILVEKMKEGRE